MSMDVMRSTTACMTRNAQGLSSKWTINYQRARATRPKEFLSASIYQLITRDLLMINGVEWKALNKLHAWRMMRKKMTGSLRTILSAASMIKH